MVSGIEQEYLPVAASAEQPSGRRLGAGVAVAIGLLALAGVAGLSWNSAQAGVRGARVAATVGLESSHHDDATTNEQTTDDATTNEQTTVEDAITEEFGSAVHDSGLSEDEQHQLRIDMEVTEFGEKCREGCLGTQRECLVFWKVDDYDWNNYMTDSQKCNGDNAKCGGSCETEEARMRKDLKCAHESVECREACLSTQNECVLFYTVHNYDWNNYMTDNQKCNEDNSKCGRSCETEEASCSA